MRHCVNRNRDHESLNHNVIYRFRSKITDHRKISRGGFKSDQALFGKNMDTFSVTAEIVLHSLG